MSRQKSLENLRALIAHPRHLAFQIELLAGMLLYLFLNLLLCQSRGDNVFLKLWGIKSVIFSLTGSYLGLRYALKMCKLSDYRDQNRTIRDVLTGMYNRQYALSQLEWLLQQRTPFALCFSGPGRPQRRQ